MYTGIVDEEMAFTSLCMKKSLAKCHKRRNLTQKAINEEMKFVSPINHITRGRTQRIYVEFFGLASKRKTLKIQQQQKPPSEEGKGVA